MRWAVLAVVLAGAVSAQRVAVSPADAQERETVAKLLASEKDSDKAWGAVLAAKYKQSRFVPEIFALLNSADQRVRLAALDALIELEVQPSSEVMTALLDAHPEHFEAALLLMGRLRWYHREFLESLLTRNTSRPQWAALNAVLAKSPGETQATYLWNEWRLELGLVVTDMAANPKPEGGQAMCLDAISIGSDGFPEVGFQRLFEAIRPQAHEVYIDGPHRFIRGKSLTPHDGCYLMFPRQRYVRDYLEYFGGSGPKLPEMVVTWRSTGRFRRDAKALLAKIRAYVTGLRERLVAEELLAPDAPLPSLWVSVSDQRRDKRTPLPDFDWTF